MLEKKYDHKVVEKNKYNDWKEKGYFKSGDITKKPYSIVIPPPNVTGKLHLGHALDTTLQDIIIRFKRMQGFDALWLPGMDHAGIATQAKVDQKLRELEISPRSLKREKWLEYAWDWKKEYANTIRNQWEKMGLSLDYSKERFTLDEGLNNAVNEVFIKLYNKGYIYRGERIINWDPKAMTALSNVEVIHKEVKGAFYHLKYMIENEDNYIEIATTRPETLFGDTAIAVNKKDERYKDLIGKQVIIPICNRKIPIITDIHADMKKGTGAVKITPAHDPNDFLVGQRNKLPMIKCMNKDASMNENAGKYNKMDRFECRKKLIKELKEKDLIVKIENHIHQVGHSERTNEIIEPYLSKQWFVKMDNLSKNALKNQLTKNKVNFIPERFEKIFKNWMEDTLDWCISRQLWWGHRIPAWYKEDKIYVGKTAPKEDGWVQDEDVLDTWFSSALWPFSSLGWPEKTKDLERYFPTSCLVTGYDLIFFWISRMIFQSIEFTEEKPFNDVLIHGLIRDKNGIKMSKSLGNGIDPFKVIEEYGADSLRFFLTTNSAPGQDLRYDDEKVKSTWNFINKIWNASRFVLMNINDFKSNDFTLENLELRDKWILHKLNKTINKVTKEMEKYEFNNVGNELYNFIWNDFCDWYIELSKFNQTNTTKSVLVKVLTDILKMLHPFMPYVTEEIYQKLPIKEDTIMLSNYPIFNENQLFKKEYNELELIITTIKEIRNKKVELNITKVFDFNYNFEKYSKDLNNLLNYLLNKELKLNIENKINDYTKIEIITSIGIINVLYDGNENKEKEKEKNKKEILKLEDSIKRREKLLKNENYIKKAPKELIEKEKLNLNEEQNKLNLLKKKL